MRMGCKPRPSCVIRAWRVLSYALDATVDATPQWAARTLLHEELEHWAAHLGETNVTGADTIRLRQYGLKATDCLDAESDAPDRYRKV